MDTEALLALIASLVRSNMELQKQLRELSEDAPDGGSKQGPTVIP